MLKYTELQFCVMFCVDVNVGLVHSGSNVGRGDSIIGCGVEKTAERGALWSVSVIIRMIK